MSPPRAPKVCGHATCHLLARDGGRYCPEHHKIWKRGNVNRVDTTERRTMKARVLRNAGNRCQIGYLNICIGTATQVDRIDNTRGYEDDNNLAAACQPCHQRKSSNEGNAAQGHRTTEPPRSPAAPTPTPVAKRGVPRRIV
jgi:5-methylcytosine-specific restriction enzyme A